MRFLIIFLCILIFASAKESKDESENESSTSSKDDSKDIEIKKVITNFSKKAEMFVNSVDENTEDVIELSKEIVEKLMSEAENDVRTTLKDFEKLIKKFGKIKQKCERDLKECADQFTGESSKLGRMLTYRKELDVLIKEIQKCPADITGMGCTLGKVMRGEEIIEEIDKIIKSEKQTAKERSSHIVKTIKKCNEKAINDLTKSIKELMVDLKKIRKEEL